MFGMAIDVTGDTPAVLVRPAMPFSWGFEPIVGGPIDVFWPTGLPSPPPLFPVAKELFRESFAIAAASGKRLARGSYELLAEVTMLRGLSPDACLRAVTTARNEFRIYSSLTACGSDSAQ
jgi:hypothetical protein